MKTFLIATLLVAAVLMPVASAAPPSVGKCVTAVDDMINDGGSTYCVNHNGCLVYESREYIWGRETYCYG